MTNTENLFELVYILLNKKQVTANELASHFGVSSRTIYRWIDSLCIAGVPIFTTKGSGGGIQLDENYSLDKTVLTEEERLSIIASLNAMKSLTGSESTAASKLKSLSKENADWLEVDFGTWNPLGQYVRTVFDILKKAILNRTIVVFDYFATSGNNFSRTVHPWKIVFRGQAWYLYGFCETKNEPRYFKLSRIQNIRNTNKRSGIKFQKPVEENEYSEGYNDKEIVLKLRVNSKSVYRVMDELFVQNEERDGDFSILTVLALDCYWLYSWLLSFGTELDILEPDSVRIKYQDIVKQMYEKIKCTL